MGVDASPFPSPQDQAVITQRIEFHVSCIPSVLPIRHSFRSANKQEGVCENRAGSHSLLRPKCHAGIQQEVNFGMFKVIEGKKRGFSLLTV